MTPSIVLPGGNRSFVPGLEYLHHFASDSAWCYWGQRLVLVGEEFTLLKGLSTQQGRPIIANWCLLNVVLYFCPP